MCLQMAQLVPLHLGPFIVWNEPDEVGLCRLNQVYP